MYCCLIWDFLFNPTLSYYTKDTLGGEKRHTGRERRHTGEGGDTFEERGDTLEKGGDTLEERGDTIFVLFFVINYLQPEA